MLQRYSDPAYHGSLTFFHSLAIGTAVADVDVEGTTRVSEVDGTCATSSDEIFGPTFEAGTDLSAELFWDGLGSTRSCTSGDEAGRLFPILPTWSPPEFRTFFSALMRGMIGITTPFVVAASFLSKLPVCVEMSDVKFSAEKYFFWICNYQVP